MNVKTVLKGAACCLILGVLASTAAARLRIDKYIEFLPGVNLIGDISFAHGNNLNIKVFNYTRLDLLVATAKGKVTNDSGRVFVETNFGVPIRDFDNLVTRISTSDVYVVGPKKGFNRAAASGVAVFNPNAI